MTSLLSHLSSHDLTYATSGYPVYDQRAKEERISVEELNRRRAIWVLVNESAAMAARMED